MTDITADDLVGGAGIKLRKRKLWLLLVLVVWSLAVSGDVSPRLEKPPEPKCPVGIWGVSHFGEACYGGEVIPERLPDNARN